MLTKSYKNHRLAWLVIGLSAIFLIINVRFLFNSYQLAQQGREKLEKAITLTGQQKFDDARKEIKTAQADFIKARNSLLKSYLLRPLPWVGQQLKTANLMLRAAVQVTGALDNSLALTQDLLKEFTDRKNISFASISSQDKEKILNKLANSHKPLREIKEYIEQTINALEQISTDNLHPALAKQIKPIKNSLPKLKTLTDKFFPLLETLPVMLGSPKPVTYLFLLQNNNELRPTGGFIGTYGILKLHNADITKFQTDNVYSLDDQAAKFLKIPPPAPLAKYLKAQSWFLRDANWSPDFGAAAQQAEWFYHQERGPEARFDGVLAITPTYMASILKVIGGQTVDNVTFTAGNLADVLENRVGKEYYSQGIDETQRKAIVGKLGLQIKDQLFKLPVARLAEIVDVTLDALEEKHFLIYSKVPEAQKLVEKNNWAGRIRPADTDFMAVFDANLASLKTDSVIDREIRYDIKPSGQDIVAKVSIKYINEGKITWKTTRLRNWTRVYVPKGSQLITATGLMDNDRSSRPGQIETGEEFDKTYFAGFIAIEPGQTGTLSFEYRLPLALAKKIKENGYKLLVQKQPGTIAHRLNVNVQLSRNISQFTPSGFGSRREKADTVIFTTDLKTDREFSAK